MVVTIIIIIKTGLQLLGRGTLDFPDFVHAIVEVAASVEELDEGSHAAFGDLLRGRSYSLYRGLLPLSTV